MNKQQNREYEELNRLWGKRGYCFMGICGRGTDSIIYRLERFSDGKKYACKVRQDKRLLEQEAVYLQQIKHPLFPKFEEYWQGEENGFLVMEYVEGSSLESLLIRRGRLSQREAVRMVMALAEGLSFLHGLPEPIFYRDIKPANIMVQPDGNIRLLDLGAACTYGKRKESRGGTPGYASPEQFGAEGEISGASEVYQLGMLLHHMLTGVAPRRGELPPKPIRYYDRKLYHGMERIVCSCLEEHPMLRIPDMRQLMEALSPYQMEGKAALWLREIKYRRENKKGKKYCYEKNVWRLSR